MEIHCAAARCSPLIALLCLPAGAQIADDSQASLTLPQAQAYMVTLINHDRQASGLAPVVLDAVASRAAQSHTDEMVRFGYLSHWGLDGKKPTQRYTEGGGVDSDMENATYDSGWHNHPADTTGLLPVTQEPKFSPKELEDFEAGFMDEPKDQVNHRSNILDPHHTRVGIAMSRAVSGEDPQGASFYRVGLTQEFIDGYGTYSPIPLSLQPGAALRVAGTLAPGFTLHSVELRKEGLPSPMTIAELSATYSVPAGPANTFANYFPDDSSSGLTMSATPKGQGFSVPVATQTWQPGLYYVEVWATNKEFGTLCVSRRTMVVAGHTPPVEPAHVAPVVTPVPAATDAVLWKPWKVSHEATPQLSHVHVRRGCVSGPTPNAPQEWVVQYSNDDPASSYRVVFQLVPAGGASPSDWPNHAMTVMLPPAGKTPSMVSTRFKIAVDCAGDPRLYDSIDVVNDAAARH
jgi:uncharacterized protein YkwD